MTPYKPAGYNAVSPYFIVENANSFIELICKVFEAEVTRKYETPDGTIMHAEIKIDDSVIMVSSASDMYGANKHMMHVYVENVDQVFERAIALGCKSMQKPVQKNMDGDTDRRGSFMDFAGNHWSVATQA